MTLGIGGVLVLKFNINIVDGEGEDIYIFEVGESVESTLVEVSSDLNRWYRIGTARGSTTALDMKGKVPEGMGFRYVRLTDLKDEPTGRWPGADIDAVAGLNVKPVTSSWAVTEMDKAEEYGLKPDILKHAVLDEPITRLEFACLSVKVYESLAGTRALPSVVNPFTDCSDVELKKAYNLGITNGTSATTFSPNELLTREQAAAMLTRTFKRATMPGWTLDSDAAFPLRFAMPARFSDDALISGYARENVYFMVANGIKKGVGSNLFAPRNSTPEQAARNYANATREQALAIAVRMYEGLR